MLSCILLFGAEDDVRDALAGPLVRLLDDVGINIGGGTDLCMSQAFGDRHAVQAVKIQEAGHRMAEFVRVDVRQSVLFGELRHPACEAVWVRWLAVVLDEHIAAVDPAVPVDQALLGVPGAVFPQQLHRFRREFDVAGGAGLGGVLINPAPVGAEQSVVNFDLAVFPVDAVPFETGDLSPPASRNQKEVGGDLPFERLML